jgi:hypothetical protein
MSTQKAQGLKPTIFGVLLGVRPVRDIRRFIRKYGCMLRFAFQRLVGGLRNLTNPTLSQADEFSGTTRKNIPVTLSYPIHLEHRHKP